MINNGKINVKRVVDNGYVIESFTYDHKKAIESSNLHNFTARLTLKYQILI